MEFIKEENTKLKETIYRTVHPSGLHIYVMPKTGYSKSGAYFSTHYGSVDRQFILPGDTEVTTVPDGIAHFLEHKVFEQEGGENVFEEYAKYGGNANAFTAFSMTTYYFTCSENFYENFHILMNFVTKPYFTAENVAKEQGIIGQEIRMYDDDPDWRVYFNAIQSMYHNHPVKIDIAGTVESISKIDADVLYRCYRGFYHPSNMALFVIGDVDCDRISEIVDEYVGGMTENGEIKRVFEPEPTSIVTPYREQKLSVSIPQFVLAFKDSVVGGTSEEMAKREVLTDLIWEMLIGKSSALYRNLYESGKITGPIGTEYSLEPSYAFSMMSGEAKEPKEVRDAVMQEIKRLMKEGFDPDVLERTKRAAYGKFVQELNSIENIGTGYLSALWRGTDYFKTGEMILSVTKEEMEARLKEHFKEEQAVLSVVLPA